MSKPTFRLTTPDAHLFGKLLSISDDVVLTEEGFTDAEKARAEVLFEYLDDYLVAAVGRHWEDISSAMAA